MREFTDRTDAGRQLARHLAGRIPADAVVLGLPRGGVPVAAVVARELDLPLDVLVVRKVGVPWHPEVAMAAVGEEDAVVRNDEVIAASGTTAAALAAAEQRERAEVRARASRFREGTPAPALHGRCAVIVDDGIATGASVRAACAIARARGATRVVVAVPVAPPEVVTGLQADADEVISLVVPDSFMAVGLHYRDFRQTPDEEVIRIMADAARG